MLYPNPQIFHPLRSIFIHVPKTAGTSIEKTLGQQCGIETGGHSTAESIRKKHPVIFEEYVSFAVLRNPEDRFNSAFSYLLNRSIHPALGNEIIHQAGNLSTFLDIVLDDPIVLEKIVHFWPQFRFICDQNKKVIVDDVLCFESLNSDWLAISKKIGIGKTILRKENVSTAPNQEVKDSDQFSEFIRKTYKVDYDIMRKLFPTSADSKR